jgi:hypothetical protein
MRRSRNLDRITRYQWFESTSLQRRVRCEPDGSQRGVRVDTLSAKRPIEVVVLNCCAFARGAGASRGVACARLRSGVSGEARGAEAFHLQRGGLFVSRDLRDHMTVLVLMSHLI